MNKTTFIDHIGLTPDQLEAVHQRDVDLAVTAGAGSGKTRTLVSRYLDLLGEGLSPMKVAAVTFTEKAAREMRSRIRSELHRLADDATTEADRQMWEDLEGKIDAARIGTIHSLCAEIIRSHPVEAQVDPQFSVADEGRAAIWRRDAVADALAWAVERPSMEIVFRNYSIYRLASLLNYLASRRLDFPPDTSKVAQLSEEAVGHALDDFMRDPLVTDAIAALSTLADSGELDDGQLAHTLPILNDWEEAKKGDVSERAAALFRLRREHALLPGKSTAVKEAVLDLRVRYDALINPWLGGEKKGDHPPDQQLEADMPAVLACLSELFTRVAARYDGFLRDNQALDFDDLESRAHDVLRQPGPRSYWQKEILAILVDEFQDTNRRQRAIVDFLSGDHSGRLFVVGDARQSIYRFRGADVTVFRNLQRDIEGRGGQVFDLKTTFRAHSDLLMGINDLIEPIMGKEPRPGQPYWVPFEPLEPYRDQARAGVDAPYIEFVLGGGAGADEGRQAAAAGLARRLKELYAEGQIINWEDVVLLFRASTAFPFYEDALEAAGIPSVTVAGRGFYDRPEVRDILNMVKALADPWDDLAFTGLLRSPAVGVSDAGIFRLRWQGGQLRGLRSAIVGDLSELDESDQAACRSALALVEQLEPTVGRTTVAELLKQVVDLSNYRAVLAAAPNRLWRNLDKLLVDAQQSGLVRVHDYLDYLTSLRDVGARESEAAVEAGDSVRLMTIHKSKGLEFNLVVLADAGRKPVGWSSPAYLLPEVGLAVQPNRADSKPLAQRLSAWMDREQEKAEDRRLLYVALTRAREKLLVSGHLSESKTGWRASGWLKELLDIPKVSADDAVEMGWDHKTVSLKSGSRTAVLFQAYDPIQTSSTSVISMETKAWPERNEPPLFAPLQAVLDKAADREEQKQDWRATGEDINAPAVVTGSLVHEALQRWRFPDHVGFEKQMDVSALRHGLIALQQRQKAVKDARRMLANLRSDPLWKEINAAAERHHELPYVLKQADGTNDNGKLDLLYGSAGEGWTVMDFKTDELNTPAAVEEAVRRHSGQMRRYGAAVQQILGQSPVLKLCFLNTYQGVLVQAVVV